MSSQQSTSETSPVALSELEQQQMLEWKEKQELAEAQEQEILEQDLKYREYANEQNEKYNKYNDDMKNFTLADTPKVQLYKNYVLYDRFMPYNRFRPSIKYNDDDDDKSEKAERNYYYNNYHNFLVVKFSKTINDLVLFDTVHNCLYISYHPLHSYAVQRIETGDYPYLEIEYSLTDANCLNIIDDQCCSNIHNNGNGYCDDCQYNSQELKKLNCDRFLTYSEFICLPEFKEFYDFEFNQGEDEEDSYRCYHTFDSDTDYDDRRHGPEDTHEDDSDEEEVEDDSDEEEVEEKEERWMEGEEECVRNTYKSSHSFREYTTKNGVYHSFNDQPAITQEDDNRDTTLYVWYKNGVKHRLSGVGEQYHKDRDDIASYYWWIEGVRYYTKKEFEEALKAYKN